MMSGFSLQDRVSDKTGCFSDVARLISCKENSKNDMSYHSRRTDTDNIKTTKLFAQRHMRWECLDICLGLPPPPR